jgi:hypothetical protein
MPTTITTPQEFRTRVKDVARDQLLIFHSSQTNPARVNQFNIIARSTALAIDKPLDIFTINIDVCRLARIIHQHV